MNGTEPAIATQAIAKRYGDVTAVDAVDLRVNPGEIYALLGLNGAGKTTLIRLLLGMVRPTSGGASILGHHIRPAAGDLWASVGYLVETPSAYPELTVEENLRLAWRLRRLTDPDSVSTVIGELGLTPYARRRARDLSLGNTQRLGLAKALLHRPRSLLLDEPSNGLDPAGVVEIRDLLYELTHQNGVTILLSSHILTEVARLANRIGIIHRGRLIDDETPGSVHMRAATLLTRVGVTLGRALDGFYGRTRAALSQNDPRLGRFRQRSAHRTRRPGRPSPAGKPLRHPDRGRAPSPWPEPRDSPSPSLV